MLPGLLTILLAVVPCAPAQAVMLPVIESNRNAALTGLPPPVGTKLKLPAAVPAVLTVPVGKLSGIVIVCGLAFSTNGLPETSPLRSWVVLVPLLTTQKGLLALALMPHGFTKSGS